mmetsp:Transcript_29608/g.54249  ORF Transcript_29608/g.54249 Transcript_29608/m.54249 type:complete len:273 (+) Transcript_29608:485-1303(+)
MLLSKSCAVLLLDALSSAPLCKSLSDSSHCPACSLSSSSSSTTTTSVSPSTFSLTSTTAGSASSTSTSFLELEFSNSASISVSRTGAAQPMEEELPAALHSPASTLACTSATSSTAAGSSSGTATAGTGSATAGTGSTATAVASISCTASSSCPALNSARLRVQDAQICRASSEALPEAEEAKACNVHSQSASAMNSCDGLAPRNVSSTGSASSGSVASFISSKAIWTPHSSTSKSASSWLGSEFPVGFSLPSAAAASIVFSGSLGIATVAG